MPDCGRLLHFLQKPIFRDGCVVVVLCFVWLISRYYTLQQKLFLRNVRWLKEGVLDNREIYKIIAYATENAPDFMGYTHDDPTKNEATRNEELIAKFLDFYGATNKLRQVVDWKRNQKNTSADWISFVDTLQYSKYMKQYDVILGKELASFMKGEKMLTA